MSKKWKDLVFPTPLKHFKIEEFDDPTVPDTGIEMDSDLVYKLDAIREECNFPFLVTSGFRTREHNEELKAKANSAHTTGNAVDIFCTSGARRMRMVQVALSYNIKRIGVKKDCVHLDNSPSLPSPSLWTYD